MRQYWLILPVALVGSVVAAPVENHHKVEEAAIAELPTVLVTAQALTEPNAVEVDLKVPRQPLPAHDGADYLKTIPGFSVTRKGGADGDPVFRGVAGSRLNILVDGQTILGGCNARMDAPTAYIHPELYDKLTIIKGPQTVRYGGGSTAATIMFERHQTAFEKGGAEVYGSATVASFNRRDEVLDARIGSSLGYVQLNGSDARSDDYKDGNGNAVHSAYERYNAGVALGLTPDKNTHIELSGLFSDGEASYADRGMDGTKYRREGGAVKFGRKWDEGVVRNVHAEIYQATVDHVMDDQTRRTPGMMGYSGLGRETAGARINSDMAIAGNTLTLGVDAQKNTHDSRSAPPSGIYTALKDDAGFQQYGIFSEISHPLDDASRFVAGYRADHWQAKDERATIRSAMGGTFPNPTAGQKREEWLNSGFFRLEKNLTQQPITVYAGFGYTERFPDYWEMIAKESMTSRSAFDTNVEKNNQIDVGMLYEAENINVATSLFMSDVRNFIIVDYTSPMKSNGATRNVHAESWGGEVSVDYRLFTSWKLSSTLSYADGENKTDKRYLPQMSPLEGRVGLTYENEKWSVGALARMVAAQDHFAKDMGNVVGKDIGPSAGFSVFSLNAGWRPVASLLLSAGVDNLFDKNYAEFVSRAGGNGMGGAIPGYVQTNRVNEPGRTAWLKATLTFK